MPDQPPISSYGLIGDLRTAALVGLHGGVDWCCLPRFDSPSVFAAILDPDHGGSWIIQPDEPYTTRQRYLPSTNILETTFRTDDGEVRVVDFMPVGLDGKPPSRHPELHRQVTCTGGRSVCESTSWRGSTTPPARPGSKSCATASSPPIAGKRSPHSPERAPFEWNINDGRAVALFADRGGRYPLAGAALRRRRRSPGGPLRQRPQARGDRRVLAGLGLAASLHRTVPHTRRTLRPGAQAAYRRRERRYHRRADYIPPRGTRRSPQLGLSLRLAAGRCIHSGGARRRGTSRGSGSLHALPQTSLPARVGPAPADHVRSGRTPGADRALARSPERLLRTRAPCGWETPRRVSCSSMSTETSWRPRKSGGATTR